ncbi:GSCOCG00013551001-RA-CDS [Cotesia congregata]|uniref:Elongator complex protein 4 n=1 Tax=Cotesia congregata TaxID=51543 RepID=A0A8J2EJ24_COTCN|nr:GSCOCG00013551001-RA-CDS [Cotesia congregata]CAG5074376.1 Similar to elp4: Elongator complex protein 4 (Danio rerio) [Cotesia congregata]
MTNNDSKSIKKSQSTILGTKPSFINAQLLISTGIPSLDTIIGGGLPIGTILLLEEDKYGNYAKTILKYFLAEGCVAKHNLLIASQDFPPDKLIFELPAVISCEDKSTSCSAVSASPLSIREAERMKIAWRYENMKASDPLATKSKNSKYNSDFGHFFDLTKKMDPSLIDRDRIFCLADSDITTPVGNDKLKCHPMGFRDCRYTNLLKKLQRELKSGGFYVTDKPEKRNIMRIVIHGLGSRLWISDQDPEDHGDLVKFFYCFRSLMRNCYAVAAISVSDILTEDDTIMMRIENLSDTAIAMESFAGSSKETNPIFKDYHGLLYVKKLSAINTLAPHCPESYDLAFKMRRKKFVIEILHLPPDFGEEKEEKVAKFGCGSSKLLDF